MSLFINKTAQDARIVKPAAAKKANEGIFDRYVRITLDKLERSIEDAQGRYELGKSYSRPVPSQNWRVVKQVEEGEDVLGEQVECFLKIGIKKMVVGENGETVLGPIAAADLIDCLLVWKNMVESVRDNPESDVAKAFHAEAIEQARPKTNADQFCYFADKDRYLAREEADQLGLEWPEVESTLKSVS